MKEINYGFDMRMTDAPKIVKKGIVGKHGESTPFLWHGRLKWLHTRSEGDAQTFVFNSYFIIRDDETDEVTPPLCPGYHFYSCYEENGTLYVFGTNEHEGRAWGGDTITMMWSNDLVNWEKKDVIHRPGWEYFNTSVCRGRNGKYVMAIEAGKPQELVGKQFTIFFAESDDLMNWKCMCDDLRYNDERYTACPALRYLPSDDYYYMICLEELPLVRYAPYIYRTKDFDTWEVGIHNPVLWISPEDRMMAPGVHFEPEIEELAKTYININNCDLDLIEYEGKTKITYLTGDQMSRGFGCEAEYDGTLEQFLQAHFGLYSPEK